MKNLSRTFWAVAAVAVLGVAIGAGTASAEPGLRLDLGIVSVNVGGDAGYWTPARMRAAKPADVLAKRAYQRSKDNGLLGTVTDIVGAPFSRPETRAAATEAPTTAADAATVKPLPHVGKVFFSLPGSGDYVCSANSVTSGNKDVVATAGHCLNEGPGAYASNWTFVPAYDEGSAPYGKWTARKLFAPAEWVKSGNINFDTGFAVLAPLNGRHLAAAVGASGIAFSQPKLLSYTLYGYPAAAPYSGEKLEICAGKAVADTHGDTTDQGVSCKMTSGSSGGPWFVGSGSRGKQNSVNSFGYNEVRDVMYGPYWGTVSQNAYKAASAA